MSAPVLPPALSLITLDPESGAFARAVRAAPRGTAEGTVYWTDRDDRLEIAFILEPETDHGRTIEAAHTMTVAVGDALAERLPAGAPLSFAWPTNVLLGRTRLGRTRVAEAPSIASLPPPWLVLGVEIRTSLLPGVAATDLAQAIAEHFLVELRRLREQGFAPIRERWNARGRAAVGGHARGLDAQGRPLGSGQVEDARNPAMTN